MKMQEVVKEMSGDLRFRSREFESMSVREFVDLYESNEISIGKDQRSYLWVQDNILSLFTSLFLCKHIPEIMTYIPTDTPPPLSEKVSKGYVWSDDVKYIISNTMTRFIYDGGQRARTLYQALKYFFTLSSTKHDLQLHMSLDGDSKNHLFRLLRSPKKSVAVVDLMDLTLDDVDNFVEERGYTYDCASNLIKRFIEMIDEKNITVSTCKMTNEQAYEQFKVMNINQKKSSNSEQVSTLFKIRSIDDSNKINQICNELNIEPITFIYNGLITTTDYRGKAGNLSGLISKDKNGDTIKHCIEHMTDVYKYHKHVIDILREYVPSSTFNKLCGRKLTRKFSVVLYYMTIVKDVKCIGELCDLLVEIPTAGADTVTHNLIHKMIDYKEGNLNGVNIDTKVGIKELVKSELPDIPELV